MKQLIITFAICMLSSMVSGQIESDKTPAPFRINSIQVSTLVGSSKIGFGARYKSLYNIKNLMKVGWGVGLESYSSKLERNFIPLTFDIIGDLIERTKTPFYMFSIGYGIPLKEDVEFARESKGGLVMDISVGYRSKKNATQPFISIGYRMQNASYEGRDVYGNENKEVVYKRWSLTAGLLF